MNDDSDEALSFAYERARRHLSELATAPAKPSGADAAAWSAPCTFPEDGIGTLAALETVAKAAERGATRSSGPRFFHFVTGGATPAALGADWLTSAFDQNSFSWVSSPVGTRLEAICAGWLLELFNLPASWGGILTTGTTTAHITSLAAARGWCAERQGIDVDAVGLAGMAPIPIFSSGYIHTTARKALAALGLGRRTVEVLAEDGRGAMDVDALRLRLRVLGGSGAIVIATAGDVNTGHFDPLAEIADVVQEYGAWLHVDGAFGLFAALSPRTAHLVAGLDRADSVAADGHKWLNVPYDCGFALLANAGRLERTFTIEAEYISRPEGRHPDFGHLGLESSRRARAFAVYATLLAYGRTGYRSMVERHLNLASRLAKLVKEAGDLELLADAPLNIVCFRYRPSGFPDGRLDELNSKLGSVLLADGRVYVGTTRYSGKVALRPAVTNWRTKEEDIDQLIDVVSELCRQVAAGA